MLLRIFRLRLDWTSLLNKIMQLHKKNKQICRKNIFLQRKIKMSLMLYKQCIQVKQVNFILYQLKSMSKNKGKDKKNENLTGVQALVQEQKRQLLQQTFTIKKLQDRLSRITEEHHDITHTREQFQKNYQQKIDKQRIIIETHESTIKELRTKVYDLQIKKMNHQNKIRDLQRQLKQLDQTRHREMDQYKKLTQSELNKYEAQLKQYTYYMNERDEMEKDRNKLAKQLQDEKSDKVMEIANKEREKVQATDKLRDEMLHKVRDMRSNLLSLKKQQLSTTTRLAVLQNHQLTSQLEFQSKQTEKLLFQNEDMHKKLNNLQKDLQVHKQVEEQLAKRSHYSRGIIKKLTAKINQLQAELEMLQNQSKNQRKGTAKQKQESRKQDMIMSLDKSLQSTQKKYLKMQADYDVVRNQNQYLKTKLSLYEKRGQDLVSLLHGYYQDVLSGSLQVKDENYSYDLTAMKKRPIEQWNKEEIKMVVLVLLNQIAPKVTRKNLGIPNINKSNISLVNDEDQLIKFPKLSDNTSFLKKVQNKKKMQDLPTNVASKIVGSNLREWGRTVHANSVSHLSRKYRVYDK